MKGGARLTGTKISKAVGMRGPRRGLAPVARLLLWGLPPAILGGVRPIVVDAPQAASLWTRPKIGVEVFERLSPSLTDGDPSATVGRVLRVVRVQAALLHRSPRVILAAMSHVVGAVVCRLAFGVSCLAATTAGVPASERAALYDGGATAVTAALVHVGSPCAAGIPKHGQYPKSLVRMVARFRRHATSIPPSRAEWV